MSERNSVTQDDVTYDNPRGESIVVAPSLPQSPQPSPPPVSVPTPASVTPTQAPPQPAAQLIVSVPTKQIDTEFEPTNTGFAPGAVVERRPWNLHVRSKPRKTARWFADKIGILHLRQRRGRLSKLEKTDPSVLFAGVRVRHKLDSRLGKIVNMSPHEEIGSHGHYWVVKWDRKNTDLMRIQEVWDAPTIGVYVISCSNYRCLCYIYTAMLNYPMYQYIPTLVLTFITKISVFRFVMPSFWRSLRLCFSNKTPGSLNGRMEKSLDSNKNSCCRFSLFGAFAHMHMYTKRL